MTGELSVEDIQRLRASVERFVKMSNDDWELLAPYLAFRSISRGMTLAVEGKRADDIGFMLEGSMRHYYTRNGEERTTYFYFENHFVTSYISCITGKPSDITIEALTDSRLILFKYGRLRELYDLSPAWERFGRLIAEYLAIGLEERMTGLLMQSPEERYVSLLESNKQKIIERIPQHYIASYLGITPVSLSRIRSRLAEK